MKTQESTVIGAIFAILGLIFTACEDPLDEAPLDNKTEYSVTFESNGGSTVPTQYVEKGQTATQPQNPSKTGFGFAGWYSDEGLTIEYYFNESVTGNITLYADWDTSFYVITFDSTGGSTIDGQDIAHNETATRPDDPTRDGYTFIGWYSDWDCTIEYDFDAEVTESITLYAKWEVDYSQVEVIKSFVVTTDDELKEAITEVNANRGLYDITVVGILSMEPSFLNSGSILTLKGTDTECSITLNGTGSLLTVQTGNTLILDENITLKGHNANTAALVKIEGNLTMKDGSKISGNNNTAEYGYGGGVYLTGSFIMEGGNISSNSSSSDGGGVYSLGGDFIMESGEISDNTTDGSGGGVCSPGTFTMKGGKIINNTSFGGGGGVSCYNFIMEGGEISYNVVGSETHGGSGGGVSVIDFIMNGGKIINNTSFGDDGGGGVFVSNSLSMKDSEISGNTTSGNGGGICTGWRNSKVIYMKQSKIMNNMSGGQGGGIYYGSTSGNLENFIMENSEISGNVCNATSSNYAGGLGIHLSYFSGQFTMKNSMVTNNSNSYAYMGMGSGVYMKGTNAAVFTMDEGSVVTENKGYGGGYGHTYITYNGSDWTTGGGAGGVFVEGDATFIMKNGATVSGNRGGGVAIFGARFIVEDGRIIDNESTGLTLAIEEDFILDEKLTISGNYYSPYLANNFNNDSGSGIHITSGTLIMKAGGKVNNNRIGVVVGGKGTFIMEGGEISNNKAKNDADTAVYGGGVRVIEAGKFIMRGGEIFGNSANAGGGVYVNFHTPIMNPIGSFATFTKEAGGIIYGSNSGSKSNLSPFADGGNAVYGGPSYSPVYYRNTTVTASQTLHIRYENGSIVERTGDWDD